MWLEVGLAIAIALTQLVITIYGVYISVQEHKGKSAVVVGIIGIAGIFLIGWTTYRIGVSQTDLYRQISTLQQNISEIKKSTQQSAEIALMPRADDLAIPVLHSGDVLASSYDYEDVGTEDATSVRMYARTSLERGDIAKPGFYEKVWPNFVQTSKNDQPLHGTIADLQRGMPFFATAPSSAKLTARDIADLKTGKAHIFTEVEFHYQDDTGKWIKEGCFLAQPPADPKSPWHVCGPHGLKIAETSVR